MNRISEASEEREKKASLERANAEAMHAMRHASTRRRRFVRYPDRSDGYRLVLFEVLMASDPLFRRHHSRRREFAHPATVREFTCMRVAYRYPFACLLLFLSKKATCEEPLRIEIHHRIISDPSLKQQQPGWLNDPYSYFVSSEVRCVFVWLCLEKSLE